jgi:PAS domain S-box-containing protein
MAGPVDTRALVHAAGDAIVVADAAGTIVLWNPAAERIFGFAEREALGGSLDLIVPERLRARHWEGYRETMKTGRTRYASDALRVPALHKDGRSLSIAFTVALLPAAHGSVESIVAIIRDDSEYDIQARFSGSGKTRSGQRGAGCPPRGREFKRAAGEGRLPRGRVGPHERTRGVAGARAERPRSAALRRIAVLAPVGVLVFARWA